MVAEPFVSPGTGRRPHRFRTLLVLGGNLALRARDFTCENPNFVNVAVSRAQRRLHGDRGSLGATSVFPDVGRPFGSGSGSTPGFWGSAVVTTPDKRAAARVPATSTAAGIRHSCRGTRHLERRTATRADAGTRSRRRGVRPQRSPDSPAGWVLFLGWQRPAIRPPSRRHTPRSPQR